MRRQPTIDAGLEQIAAWHRVFLSGHTAQLAERHLPPDEHARDLADVTRIAAAIAGRMETDYRARRQA